MNFEDLTMADKPSTLQQIKKLDEERAKILESAKTDALTRAEEAINELTALGFDYAARFPDNVRSIVFFEAILRPYNAWATFPKSDPADKSREC